MTSKTNRQTHNEALDSTDLRPTVRLLVVLAIFKLSVLIGMVFIISGQDTQLNKQQAQLNAQGDAVTRIDTYVKDIQAPAATQAQQVILYKIFLALCEGRFATNSPAAKADGSVEACANRLYLSSPVLPVVDTNNLPNAPAARQ